MCLLWFMFCCWCSPKELLTPWFLHLYHLFSVLDILGALKKTSLPTHIHHEPLSWVGSATILWTSIMGFFHVLGLTIGTSPSILNTKCTSLPFSHMENDTFFLVCFIFSSVTEVLWPPMLCFMFSSEIYNSMKLAQHRTEPNLTSLSPIYCSGTCTLTSQESRLL